MEAFARLVRAHQDPVYRLCRRYVGPHEAEDVAQDTFLRAFVAREQLDGQRSALPWLLTIARRLCIDRLRKHRPDLDPEGAPVDGIELRPDAAELAIARDELRHLQSALAKLAPGPREAIHLVHLEGLAYAEASQVLEVPIGTIMTWLYRGRRELKRAVEGEAS